MALDLAETLPAHTLRYLVTHAEIHLNVVWRDLSDAQRSLRLDGSSGATAIHQTPALRACLLWASAINLGSGGRMADAPAEFRQMFAAADQSNRLGLFRLVPMPGRHEVIFSNPMGLAEKIVEARRDKEFR